jgi:catechol 2,3-dioxygenase-like lactoylglutathione lyase family enzyme
MESREKKLLQGIDTVIVRVSDIKMSGRWYREKLGLAPVWEDLSMNLVVLETNGPTSLTLWQTEKKIDVNKDTASYPIFKTQNAAALKEELQSRGIKVEELITEDYVSYFFFYDPDDNVLEACQVHE